MSQVVKSLIKDNRGTSSVEYGFILVMIVLAMMSALSGLADATTGMWNDVADKSAEATGN